MTDQRRHEDPISRFADAALSHLLILRERELGLGDETDRTARSATDSLTAFEQALDDLRASLTEASGFTALSTNARLSDDERQVLALTLACEVDTERQRRLALIQADPSAVRPTLQTLGTMLGGAERCARAVGPRSHLRRAALLTIDHTGPWSRQQVQPPAGLVWAFLGDLSDDPDLPDDIRQVDLLEAEEGADVAVVICRGRDRVRRRQAAMSALGGRRFLITRPASDEAGWAALVREATMTGRAIIVELEDSLPAAGRRWIEDADHLPWGLTCERDLPIADLPATTLLELDAQAAELDATEWAELFGEETPHTHRLTPEQAERVAKVLPAQRGDIDASVRRLLAGPLETLAQRIRPRHRWEDLVLPDRQSALLRGIANRYRDTAVVYDEWGLSSAPSRGLVALFAGSSGTGKTLAAEVLAGELGLDMFRLNLASVVSKYIGETEKNLDQVFDAAGAGNVVLFFDEADALFSKRSEVSDAHDRYANIEVAYLLQRVEAFDGVVVLATNFEKSIDEAFVRRIHVRIDFTKPDTAQRLAIWERQLPKEALLDDVDLDFLATAFDFTGGQIRNAAIQGAFTAAAQGTPIGMESLVRGVAAEMRKAGQLLRPETFGEWFDLVKR